MESGASVKHHSIELEDCGSVSVFIQGDSERLREGVVFLTLHDVGSSYKNWLDFSSHSSMEEIQRRCVFLHVALPGQQPGAEDFPADFVYPTMAKLGLNLVTVLDHFKVKMVVGLGDGAGANILTRFAINHPSRIHGLIAINPTSSKANPSALTRMKEAISGQDSGKQLNDKNAAKFCEAYKKRTDILPELKRIKCDVLLVAGMKSKNIADTEALHRDIAAGICSIIKVENVAEPVGETPEKTAEALLLFCQGMGLLPTLGRRGSRTDSQGEGRRGSMSMEEYDTPNIRRLSLSAEAMGKQDKEEEEEEEEEIQSPKSMADYDRPNIRRLSLASS